jgi:hypothetical protein
MSRNNTASEEQTAEKLREDLLLRHACSTLAWDMAARKNKPKGP